MTPWVLQAAGGLLLLFILFDICYTVLYARIGTGILSHRIARFTWWILFRFARLFSKHRQSLMSIGGPAILIVTMIVWITLMVIGSAMVVYPALGKSITTS